MCENKFPLLCAVTEQYESGQAGDIAEKWSLLKAFS